jgi:hypothetical protein
MAVHWLALREKEAEETSYQEIKLEVRLAFRTEGIVSSLFLFFSPLLALL